MTTADLRATARPALALLAILPLALAACGDSSGPGGGTTYDFSAFAAEVQRFVDETPGVDGVSTVLVDRDEGVVYQQSFGAFADDRVYLLASSSKMLTAGVLMRLHDQGVLDVDRPVADVVDWGAEHPAITPAHLMSSSSGLVGLYPAPTFAPYLCQFVYQGTLQDCARIVMTTTADDDQIIPPDTQFRYGGAQWQVAGAVAEVASGRSWSDLVRETYVEPCGLETLGYNNHFVQFTGAQAGYPQGFDGDPATLRPTDNPNMEGGAYASTSDYAKLLLMHLRGGVCDGGRVLSEASVRRMHEDRIALYGGSTGIMFEGYGFGWWVDRDDPSRIVDPGAYGAFPWLDLDAGYGGFLAMEASSLLGSELYVRVAPLVDQAFAAARAG